MRKKKIIAVYPYIHNKNSLSFQADVCNSWEKAGGIVCKGVRIPLYIQYFIAKLRITFNITQQFNSAKLIFGGGTPDYSIFPYCFFNEIIPMLWDCWPSYHSRLISSLKRNRIKTVIVTSSQIASMLQQRLPKIRIIYLPEGIDESKYKNEKKLQERSIDLLEFGRPYKLFHEKIISHNSTILKNHKYSNGNWVFPDTNSFIEGLADTKIAITLPRCDTHPEIARNIETLTQRYWECMLSGCIMLGKAPKELIELIGYNPVIPMDMNNPHIQVDSILEKIVDYQEIVDKNYQTALKYASWDIRIKTLKTELEKLNYSL